jgi:type VI protein secretion system component Hcp
MKTGDSPFDAFLRIYGGNPPVEGETLDYKFHDKHAFELLKFRLAGQKDLTQGRELLDLDEGPLFLLNITKDVDSATTDLFKNYLQQKTRAQPVFDKAILTLRKAAGSKQIKYLILEFDHVGIESWKLQNDDGDDLPEEIIDFSFRTIKFQYIPQSVTGKAAKVWTEAFWDFMDTKKNNTKSD